VAEAELLTKKNHRLKRLRRLLSKREARSEEGVFVVEGPTLVAEVLDSDLVVHEIYASADADVDFVDGRASIHLVAAGGLEAVLSTMTPQPVAAVVQTPVATIDDLRNDRPVLVLVDVRDPGNVGTLCRTAEAAGFAGLVLAESSVDPTNPKVVRSAAGASFRLPVVQGSGFASVAQSLREQERSVLAAALGYESSRHDLADLRTAAIVLGNEAHGLDDDHIGHADHVITIELDGPTESLNVAAAGAVLCFEALRQRRHVETFAITTDSPQVVSHD
jgi:TrmH family RNA methyltransferase